MIQILCGRKENIQKTMLSAGCCRQDYSKKEAGGKWEKQWFYAQKEHLFPISVSILNLDICSYQAGNISSHKIYCEGKFIKTT